MNPTEYERFVASVYEQEGYTTTVTPTSGDGGIDVYAVKNNEKIGIQCKHYGGTSRSVNASDIRQLYGAAAENNCTKSVIATDGNLLHGAISTADKLGVEIRNICPYVYGMRDNADNDVMKDFTPEDLTPGIQKILKSRDLINSDKYESTMIIPKIKDPLELLNKIPSFGDMWKKYIRPLKGTKVYLGNGSDYNEIEEVNFSGLTRKSINNNSSRVPIEAFRYAYNILLQEGEVMRDNINQEYPNRCSSIVVHVLATLPFVDKIDKAKGLRLNLNLES